MNNFIPILFLITWFCSPLWAILQTDTHTYILGYNENKVMAIDRLTGHEIQIDVCAKPESMIIHKTTGYVLSIIRQKISVLDLKENKVIETLSISADDVRFDEWSSWIKTVTFANHFSSMIDIYMVDTFQDYLPVQSNEIAIFKNYGYLLNQHSKMLLVLSLEHNKVIHAGRIGYVPPKMTIHNGKGYIANFGPDSVSVIDLRKSSVIKEIKVGSGPKSISIHKNRGYVANWASDSLSVIDLQGDEVYQTIHGFKYPSHIILHDDYAFVMGMSKIYIMDLESYSILKTLSNPDYDYIGFSDTHLYAGLQKLCWLPQSILLFENPYPGIQCSFDLNNDGDKAFANFEQAMEDMDINSAKLYLEQSLTAGNPKAYALAAYAFLHKKWGAVDPNLLFWYHQFSQGMDRDYFAWLSSENPWL